MHNVETKSSGKVHAVLPPDNAVIPFSALYKIAEEMRAEAGYYGDFSDGYDWAVDVLIDKVRTWYKAQSMGDVIEMTELAGKMTEALRNKIKELEARDSDAATYVESVICMRTNFTGSPPYVGWKGLGLALTEALDDRDHLRESVKALRTEIDELKFALVSTEANRDAAMQDAQEEYERAELAEAALAAASKVAVKVKPLEWVNKARGYYGASTDFSGYLITEYAGQRVGGFKLEFDIAPFVSYHDTIESAKAAAQDDYERRILAALE